MRYVVTLTTSKLDNDERDQVIGRFRERLAWLKHEISDIENVAVTSRLLWRCSALARLQVYHALFSLENVGLMRIANGVALSEELTQLRHILQTVAEAEFPDMRAYYCLPDTLPQSEHEDPDPCSTRE